MQRMTKQRWRPLPLRAWPSCSRGGNPSPSPSLSPNPNPNPSPSSNPNPNPLTLALTLTTLTPTPTPTLTLTRTLTLTLTLTLPLTLTLTLTLSLSLSRDEQSAVECNKRGLEANSAGDTATALNLFLKAYELKPAQPNYALSAANMHLKRSDPVKAIAVYADLLRDPSKLMPKQQSMAESKMAQAQATLVVATKAESPRSWWAPRAVALSHPDPDSDSDESSEYDVVSRSDL